MSNLGNNEQDAKTPERKKITLEEAIKQKLASKKQQQSLGRSAANSVKIQNMKSQQTKKSNNQRRRTGV